MAEVPPYAASPEVVRFSVRRRARVMVLDDHRLLAQMLVGHLVDRGHEALTVDATDQRLVERVLEIRPDLLLLDAVFSDDEDAGMRILRRLREEAPKMDVAIITGVVERLRHAEFLEVGACAVITKIDSFEHVARQIEDLLEGRDPMGARHRQELRALLDSHRRSADREIDPMSSLTSSERSTLEGLVAGQSVQEMAELRTVAISTVRSHVRAVLRKLGVHSQIEAVAVAAKAGIRPRPPQ